jgi:hypothetical protein
MMGDDIIYTVGTILKSAIRGSEFPLIVMVSDWKDTDYQFKGTVLVDDGGEHKPGDTRNWNKGNWVEYDVLRGE